MIERSAVLMFSRSSDRYIDKFRIKIYVSQCNEDVLFHDNFEMNHKKCVRIALVSDVGNVTAVRRS